MIKRLGMTAGPEPAMDGFWVGRASREQAEPAAEAAPRELRGIPFGTRIKQHERQSLAATINVGDVETPIAHIRNLGTDGAFVEIAAGEFSEGMLVEFVARYQYHDTPVELRMGAEIAHVSPQGIALKFGYYDDRAYSHLVHLMYAM